MSNTGVINIRGKEYQTVALRIQKFREEHPDWSILTSIIEATDERVVMATSISNNGGKVLANGHAEEYRAASQINKTSAIENCETSAIGRALACLGYGGTEFASANEVQAAIKQQEMGVAPVQLAAFIKMIKSESAIRLYALQQNDGELYAKLHGAYLSSIERGGKGKERERVDNLVKRGETLLADCLTAVQDALDSGGDVGNLLDDLDEKERQIVVKRLTPEQQEKLAA